MPPKRRFRIVEVQALGRRKGYFGRDQVAPGVRKTTDGSQLTLIGRKGDTCSYTVPFPFKLLLQFKAGAVKALTAPLAPPSVHWAGTKWGEIPGRCTKGLLPSRGINLAGM